MQGPTILPLYDQSNVSGRATRTSGMYYATVAADGGSVAGGAVSVGLIAYAPIWLPGSCDKIVIEVTSAGGASTVGRTAIYSVDQVTGRPGSKLAQCATDHAVDSLGVKEVNITLSATAGWYYAAFVTDAASLSVKLHLGGVAGMPAAESAAQSMSTARPAYFETKSGLTLPTTAAVINVSGSSPRIALRAA